MSFLNAIKAFFTTPKVNPVTVAVYDAFRAACEVYGAAYHAVQPYTTLANRRFAILQALDDPETYDEVVTDSTDPADLEPYTEAGLDTHTAVINSLTAAFDTLSSTFAAVNPADYLSTPAAALYRTCCELYKLYCEACKLAVTAYCHAAYCAVTTALNDRVQAAENRIRVIELEAFATTLTEPDRAATIAKAAAFTSKVAADETRAQMLEAKARIAVTKAKELLGHLAEAYLDRNL